MTFLRTGLGISLRSSLKIKQQEKGIALNGLGSAAYHLQYYRRESGRANNVAKQTGISKVGAAQ